MKMLPLNKGFTAFVSDIDFPRLRGYAWYVISKGSKHYAARSIWLPKKRKVQKRYLHQEIKGAGCKEIDHRDGNGLNNCRRNLRVCTDSQNQCNRRLRNKNNKSGFRGVCWDSRRQKWLAQAMQHRKCYFLGYHPDAKSAALAFDAFCRRHRGTFSVTNFS